MAESGNQKFILVALGLLTVLAGLGTLIFVGESRSRVRADSEARRSESLQAERARRVALISSREGDVIPATVGHELSTLFADREAPEGGLDLAANRKELGELLARRIDEDLRRRQVSRETTILLIAKSERRNGERNRAYAVAKEIAQRLESRMRPAQPAMAGVGNYGSFGARGALVSLQVKLEEREGLDIVSISREYGGRIASAGLYPRVEKRSGHRWVEYEYWNLAPMRFASLPTTDIEAARGDAIESLAHRIRNLVYDVALQEGYLSPDLEERKAFMNRLASRFSDTVLAGFGETRIFHSEWALEDETLYHAVVSWRPDRDAVWRASRLVSQDYVARQREPWIRMGLALGALVLAVLGWLRVDWMMKGRFGLLTKLMFSVLLAASCVLIYNVDLFHG